MPVPPPSSAPRPAVLEPQPPEALRHDDGKGTETGQHDAYLPFEQAQFGVFDFSPHAFDLLLQAQFGFSEIATGGKFPVTAFQNFLEGRVLGFSLLAHDFRLHLGLLPRKPGGFQSFRVTQRIKCRGGHHGLLYHH